MSQNRANNNIKLHMFIWKKIGQGFYEFIWQYNAVSYTYVLAKGILRTFYKHVSIKWQNGCNCFIQTQLHITPPHIMIHILPSAYHTTPYHDPHITIRISHHPISWSTYHHPHITPPHIMIHISHLPISWSTYHHPHITPPHIMIHISPSAYHTTPYHDPHITPPHIMIHISPSAYHTTSYHDPHITIRISHHLISWSTYHHPHITPPHIMIHISPSAYHTTSYHDPHITIRMKPSSIRITKPTYYRPYISTPIFKYTFHYFPFPHEHITKYPSVYQQYTHVITWWPYQYGDIPSLPLFVPVTHVTCHTAEHKVHLSTSRNNSINTSKFHSEEHIVFVRFICPFIYVHVFVQRVLYPNCPAKRFNHTQIKFHGQFIWSCLYITTRVIARNPVTSQVKLLRYWLKCLHNHTVVIGKYR